MGLEHPEMIALRIEATRKGPEFIATLSPSQRGDRFIRKLERLSGQPAHRQPWTVEYQLSQLAMSIVQSLNGGPAVEDSRRTLDACAFLIEKGWSAEQCRHALHALLKEMSTPLAVQMERGGRQGIYTRVIATVTGSYEFAVRSDKVEDLIDVAREVAAHLIRRASAR